MAKTILITGGAGFIGINAAKSFAEQGWQLVVLDNLSRVGARQNLNWLNQHQSFEFVEADVRDAEATARVVLSHQPDVVLHLAAQVAVTTSVSDPRLDFEVNALGTFNVLEAIRLHCPQAFFINASTNKVYGGMDDLVITESEGRYQYRDLDTGIDEGRPLDFHSPYGCSKGVADQYSIDYARIYDLRTVTLRQSCIYGTRQFGVEDQGWVAWFCIAAVLGKSITVFGDGKQIRDVLHVNDLLRAYQAAIANADAVTGQAINIGGGNQNTLSLLELLEYLRNALGRDIDVGWDDWRPGDQPVFVCDIQKAKELMGWVPEISVPAGVNSLIDWITANAQLFADGSGSVPVSANQS